MSTLSTRVKLCIYFLALAVDKLMDMDVHFVHARSMRIAASDSFWTSQWTSMSTLSAAKHFRRLEPSRVRGIENCRGGRSRFRGLNLQRSGLESSRLGAA